MNAQTTITAKGANGTISFNGTTITIDRPAFLSMQGRSSKTIPLNRVQAMQYTPAKRWKWALGLRGYISFTLAGGVEKQARFGRQIADAMQDENAVIIQPTIRQIAEFDALAAALQSAVDQQ